MTHMITVQTQEDFEILVKERNFVPILSIKVLEEQTIYDITVKRDDMLESLEKNLEIHVENEDYESCSKILNAINYLKDKK